MKRSKLSKIPIINVIFKISNAYVHKGDLAYIGNIAPIGKWFNRLFKGVFFSIVVVTLLFSVNFFSGENNSSAGTIIAIFPSLLGFGIGVFALLFSLPNSFVHALSTTKKTDSNIINPVRMLASDFAYPLVIYGLILFVAAISNFSENTVAMNWITSTLLIYGFVMTFELIGTLFSVVTRMIINQENEVNKIE